MPEYIYKHPKKPKYISIIQTMSEEHAFTDESGVKWERQYTIPQAVIKETINPFNSKQYVDITKRKKGNVGDLMDFSEELSNKRKQETEDGIDPVTTQFHDDWSKKRHGRIHPDDHRVPKANIGSEKPIKRKNRKSAR